MILFSMISIQAYLIFYSFPNGWVIYGYFRSVVCLIIGFLVFGIGSDLGIAIASFEFIGFILLIIFTLLLQQDIIELTDLSGSSVLSKKREQKSNQIYPVSDNSEIYLPENLEQHSSPNQKNIETSEPESSSHQKKNSNK